MKRSVSRDDFTSPGCRPDPPPQQLAGIWSQPVLPWSSMESCRNPETQSLRQMSGSGSVQGVLQQDASNREMPRCYEERNNAYNLKRPFFKHPYKSGCQRISLHSVPLDAGPIEMISHRNDSQQNRDNQQSIQSAFDGNIENRFGNQNGYNTGTSCISNLSHCEGEKNVHGRLTHSSASGGNTSCRTQYDRYTENGYSDQLPSKYDNVIGPIRSGSGHSNVSRFNVAAFIGSQQDRLGSLDLNTFDSVSCCDGQSETGHVSSIIQNHSVSNSRLHESYNINSRIQDSSPRYSRLNDTGHNRQSEIGSVNSRVQDYSVGHNRRGETGSIHARIQDHLVSHRWSETGSVNARIQAHSVSHRRSETGTVNSRIQDHSESYDRRSETGSVYSRIQDYSVSHRRSETGSVNSRIQDYSVSHRLSETGPINSRIQDHSESYDRRSETGSVNSRIQGHLVSHNRLNETGPVHSRIQDHSESYDRRRQSETGSVNSRMLQNHSASHRRLSETEFENSKIQLQNHSASHSRQQETGVNLQIRNSTASRSSDSGRINSRMEDTMACKIYKSIETGLINSSVNNSSACNSRLSKPGHGNFSIRVPISRQSRLSKSDLANSDTSYRLSRTGHVNSMIEGPNSCNTRPSGTVNSQFHDDSVFNYCEVSPDDMRYVQTSSNAGNDHLGFGSLPSDLIAAPFIPSVPGGRHSRGGMHVFQPRDDEETFEEAFGDHGDELVDSVFTDDISVISDGSLSPAYPRSVSDARDQENGTTEVNCISDKETAAEITQSDVLGQDTEETGQRYDSGVGESGDIDTLQTNCSGLLETSEPSLESRRGKRKSGVLKISNWIIKPDPKYRCVRVQGMRHGKLETSAPVAMQDRPDILLTITGTLCRLQGKMDKKLAQENDIPLNLINKFYSGFPDEWQELIEEYFHDSESSEQVDNSKQDSEQAKLRKYSDGTKSASKPRNLRNCTNKSRKKLAVEDKSTKMKDSVDKRKDVKMTSNTRNSKTRKRNLEIEIESETIQKSKLETAQSGSCPRPATKKPRRSTEETQGNQQDNNVAVTPWGEMVNLNQMKRTNSGRLSIPPLLWWTGQRALDQDGEIVLTPRQHISPFNSQYTDDVKNKYMAITKRKVLKHSKKNKKSQRSDPKKLVNNDPKTRKSTTEIINNRQAQATGMMLNSVQMTRTQGFGQKHIKKPVDSAEQRPTGKQKHDAVIEQGPTGKLKEQSLETVVEQGTSEKSKKQPLEALVRKEPRGKHKKQPLEALVEQGPSEKNEKQSLVEQGPRGKPKKPPLKAAVEQGSRRKSRKQSLEALVEQGSRRKSRKQSLGALIEQGSRRKCRKQPLGALVEHGPSEKNEKQPLVEQGPRGKPKKPPLKAAVEQGSRRKSRKQSLEALVEQGSRRKSRKQSLGALVEQGSRRKSRKQSLEALVEQGSRRKSRKQSLWALIEQGSRRKCRKQPLGALVEHGPIEKNEKQPLVEQGPRGKPKKPPLKAAVEQGSRRKSRKQSLEALVEQGSRRKCRKQPLEVLVEHGLREKNEKQPLEAVVKRGSRRKSRKQSLEALVEHGPSEKTEKHPLEDLVAQGPRGESGKQPLEALVEQRLRVKTEKQPLEALEVQGPRGKSKKPSLDALVEQGPRGKPKKQALDALVEQGPRGKPKKQSLDALVEQGPRGKPKKQALDALVEQGPRGKPKKQACDVVEHKLKNLIVDMGCNKHIASKCLIGIENRARINLQTESITEDYIDVVKKKIRTRANNGTRKHIYSAKAEFYTANK